MRRAVAAISTALILAFTLPGQAQEEEVNPVDAVLEFFQAPENAEFVARFTRPPVPGSGSIEDPIGDYGHSSGQEPGHTPPHIDITDTWALDFMPGPVDLFHSLEQPNFWNPTPQVHQSPRFGEVVDYTGEQLYDGSQYQGGAYLFGFHVAAAVPTSVTGRCEYVVWINDLTNPDTFDRNPNFPEDPAGGTNLAFGIGINPEGEFPSGTFTLRLNEQGFFNSVLEGVDVRGFTVGDYVGIFVPKELIGDLGGANFYTFCVDEGFSFAAEDSGADQTGLVTLGPDDLGTMVVEAAVVTTTTSSTTTTTAPATTTTAAPPTTDTTVPVAEGGGFPWGLVVVGGLALALAGWWLFNQEKDPCRELLEAWQKAQQECDEAAAKAAEARRACTEAEAEVEDLEEERRQVCQDWPPACAEGGEESWVEDEQGNRITSRDLHMRRLALGRVWDDYRAGKLSAEEVEAKWKEADTPEFREEMRERDAEAKAELERLAGELAAAKEKAKEACDQAEKAEGEADAACDAADAARRAYEECVAAATAPPAGGGGEATGTGPGPAGPATAGGGEEGGDPCQGQPSRKVEEAGPVDRISVTVDFTVRAEVEEGSGRNVEAGNQLVFDLNRLAQELDFAGDMLSARSAGLHVAGGVTGYAAGKYVVGTSGIVKGGIDATMATTDLLPDVPTTPVQAGTELLESVAELGAFVAGKVTEWMGNYQIFTINQVFFWQEVTAKPYNVYECRPGVGWVCVERVWEIEVGKLRKRQGVTSRTWTVNSDVRRRAFLNEMRRLTNASLARVRADAEALAAWRQRHEAGPCQ